ncbi:phosphoribosylanthranilate isomerase [Piscinibacter gummiphilus]|uniref:N-(5'-phosphoribosyl)anthranilate isomerase n=1 Tax=Piscinibacter gummiphilus TaxID=946333 RepID=A0A1W6L8K1_9BURK|nr:phosphoribosylanthranilate isomerase [Piscinibacter gummiphilus]ARN20498.1 N-(5'-phosphoribosyl)anthranilate isomerase [Piscinibacter gummiphilus]ATU65174.1 phosphoribosylanthranilate isomerase [Piscinibacter gummiphilus]GLS98427.1 N-(5'-phosphoribosyl)anthranilate isomerase [Piscinibacter gummiphilus]
MTRRTRIKICGLTREVDVDAAVEAGADAIGLNFYERSPRHVSVEKAARLASRLPPFVTPVALFVNAGAALIEAVTAAIPNAVLQFHGDERPEQCWQAGRPYLRAARMSPGFDLLNFALQYPDAQALLLDTHVESYGGSGKAFDWSLIPHGVSRPVVLSGGLHAENVIEGIFRVRPWAVDVSSGVESAKGIKDAHAIRRFCDAVREADARLAAAPN